MVGRIIGKQGKKVLELQRESHAIIEVPMGAALGEDVVTATSVTSSKSATSSTSGANAGASGSSSSTTNASNLPAAVINGILQSGNNETMLVKLLGHFWALQVSRSDSC